MISPEFETELVKKVLGQPAHLSRHGAADRQLAHEICFNIDDKMLPYLLGADLLRVLHKEILASTAEHTSALHERFAMPVPCRDKTKLLLTLRQRLTDLKELQAAGSSPSKETVMQFLKKVTGGIRDLNNVHENTDLLAPNDSGKLYCAFERKVAGWAVMDADTRLNPVFAARDQTKRLSMIVDSGAEVHLVCPAHKHFLTNVTKLSVPLQLETAEGDLTLDVIGGLLSGGIVCHGCVFNPLLSVSLFSAARGEKDGHFYERCPEDYGVLEGPRGNVKLERSGGLDYLVVGGEGQHVFSALLSHGSVDGSYCRVGIVDMEHLRGGHLEFDPGCTTCTSMTMRGRTTT